MEKLKSTVKQKLEKVNVQVSLLTCSLIVLSCLVIYLVTSEMMVSLLADAYNERANLTFETIESHIDDKLYADNVPASTYNAVYRYLSMVNENMSVSEIFLVRKDSDDIKYILDTKRDSEQQAITQDAHMTRKIEKRIEDIYITNYVSNGDFYFMGDGCRYVNFYPINSDGFKNIKAVVCIAIDARKVNVIQIVLRVLVAIIVLLCCLISIRFSNKIFKKISNPLYQDSSNTDALTGLKNKNSFAVDLHNIENGSTERYSVVTVDLNGLKTINDTRGHQMGDMFIQKSAKILKDAMEGTGYIGYRIGGDEFSVILKDCDIDEIKAFVERINEETDKNNQLSGIMVSMSIGYAKFDKDKDRNFSMTIERSDAMMYENKRLYYRQRG